MEEVKKNKIFFLSFLFFVLITLLIPSAIGEEEVEEIDITQTTTTFYVNSELPIYGTYTMGKLPLKYPDRCKIYLKNPVGEIVYMSDEKTDMVTEMPLTYLVLVKDRGLRIPFLASSGVWKVELIFYSKIFGDLENVLATGVYTINVGNSGILDHMFAPIYWYWDMYGPAASGDEIAIGLPGVIYLSALVWVPALLIVIVKYKPYRRIFKLGKKVYETSKKEAKKT